jgi:hypothetical protein
MARAHTSILATPLILGLGALGALALSATQADAVNPAVSAACASDYLAYCSQHPTEGPGVRRCMRANGLRLSTACINALIAAGEVSRQEVARRANGR